MHIFAVSLAVDKLPELQSTLSDGSISEKCQSEAMQELMTCLTDDSMAVKIGCCSKDCSSGIKKVSIVHDSHTQASGELRALSHSPWLQHMPHCGACSGALGRSVNLAKAIKQWGLAGKLHAQPMLTTNHSKCQSSKQVLHFALVCPADCRVWLLH